MIKNSSFKKIILMRHAHAVIDPSVKDIDRNLSNKGAEQASKSAAFVADLNIEKILVSPAMRAAQTLNLASQKSAINNVEVIKEIYDASEYDLLNIVSEQEDDINNLMVIGHNPSICALLLNMIRTDDEAYEYILQTLMPPSMLVAVEFPELRQWSDLHAKNQGIIRNMYLPT